MGANGRVKTGHAISRIQISESVERTYDLRMHCVCTGAGPCVQIAGVHLKDVPARIGDWWRDHAGEVRAMSEPINYEELGRALDAQLQANGFSDKDGQVFALGEEVGEFTGAYRRWSGRARRTDTWEHVEEELADVVIASFITAARLGIDLDAAVRSKTGTMLTRGWKEVPQ